MQKAIRIAAVVAAVALIVVIGWIIKLNGSIELAPILGLTDVIVDIVETGGTIKENHLKVIEEFKDISARFIANKTSFKFENEIITDMMNKLGEQIK